MAAQQWKPAEEFQKRLTNFTPGLVTALADTLIADGSCSDCLNVHFNDGFINKREGYAKYRATGIGGKVESLFEYRKANGSVYIIAATADHVYSDNGTGWTEIATITGKPSFVTFADTLLMLTGDGVLKKWDGTGSFADVTAYTPVSPEPTNGFSTVTGFKYMAVYKNRLYLAGNATYPNQVWFSEIGRYDYFPIDVTDIGDYWFMCNSGDGDKITAFGQYPDALVIFKERSIWALVGSTPDPTLSDTHRLIPVNSTIGTTAQATVVQTHGNVIFRGADGVYALTGLKYDQIGFRSMSDAVDPNIRAGYANRASECAVAYQNKYWLTIDDGVRETYLMDYTMKSMPWTRYSIAATAFLKTQDDKLLFGDADGWVYQFGGVDSDDGSAITAYWEGKADTFNTPERAKKWKKLWLQFYTYSQVSPVSVKYDVDGYGFSDPVTVSCSFPLWGAIVWGEAKWGGSQSQTQRVSNWSPRQGRHLKLRIEHAELNRRFSIHSIVMTFFYRNAR
jgi:hypothetical protein